MTNAYDWLGRMTSSRTLMGGHSRALAYTYFADGTRQRITHPDGTHFDFTYDPAGKMVTVAGTHGSTNVAVATLGYDTLGRPSNDLLGAANAPYTYYDGLPLLKTEKLTFANLTGNLTITLTENPAGQIITQVRNVDGYAYSGAVALTRSYAVNGLNQYKTAGPAMFSYDANGDLTSDGTNAYGYDAENRLISATGGLTLTYDPLGRLFQTAGGASGTTQFLYDGDDLVEEYDGSNPLLRRYTFGPGDDHPLLWDEGGTLAASGLTYLLADHEGSVIAGADSSGNVKWVNAYDDYGIPNTDVNGHSTNTGRFTYTGQIWLPDLGMYHYKARVYSPTLGRFLQTDPVGYKSDVDLYTYVNNDPADERDPSGECPPAICGGGDSIGFGSIDAVNANDSPQVSRQFTWQAQGAAQSTLSIGSNNGASGSSPAAEHKPSNRPSRVETAGVEEKNALGTNYYYKVVDKKGNLITDSHLSVSEHNKIVSQSGTIVGAHTAPGPIRPTDGIFVDHIGMRYLPAPHDFGSQYSTQTFSVDFYGSRYDLSTVFGHMIRVENGQVTESTVHVIAP